MTRLETYHLIGKHHKERISPILAQIFGFELPHQCERMATAIRNLGGEKFSFTLRREKRKKTKTALGFYFGALVRAQVMDDKGLHYDPVSIPEDWINHRRQGKVNLTDFDEADTALRLEFFYEWKKTLTGDSIRVAKELKDKDNKELLKLIDDIARWRDEQGYPYLDIEAYKKKHKMGRKAEVNISEVRDLHKNLEEPKGKPTI